MDSTSRLLHIGFISRARSAEPVSDIGFMDRQRFSIEIPQQLLQRLGRLALPLQEVVLTALEQYITVLESAAVLESKPLCPKTWSLCGQFEVKVPAAHPLPAIARDAGGSFSTGTTNYAESVDDVLYGAL